MCTIMHINNLKSIDKHYKLYAISVLWPSVGVWGSYCSRWKLKSWGVPSAQSLSFKSLRVACGPLLSGSISDLLWTCTMSLRPLLFKSLGILLTSYEETVRPWLQLLQSCQQLILTRAVEVVCWTAALPTARTSYLYGTYQDGSWLFQAVEELAGDCSAIF